MADQGSQNGHIQPQPQLQPQPQPQPHALNSSHPQSLIPGSRLTPSQLNDLRVPVPALPDYHLPTLSYSHSAPLAAIANLPLWETSQSSNPLPQFNYPDLHLHEQLDHGNIPQHLLEAANLYPIPASPHGSFELQPGPPPNLGFLNSYDPVPRLLRPPSSDEPFLEPAGYLDPQIDHNPTGFTNWDDVENLPTTRSGPLVDVDGIPSTFPLNHYQAPLVPSSPPVELVTYSVPTQPSTLDVVPSSQPPQNLAPVAQQPPPSQLLHSHSASALQAPMIPQEPYNIPQPFIAIAHYFPTLPQPQPLPSNPQYYVSDVHHFSNVTGARPLGAFAAVSAAPVALPQARCKHAPPN
jgi:hypothetical protein